MKIIKTTRITPPFEDFKKSPKTPVTTRDWMRDIGKKECAYSGCLVLLHSGADGGFVVDV